MLIRVPVEHPPRRDPKHAERTWDQEPDPPSISSRERNDQERSDERTNHRGAVEHADRQRRFTQREPLRDALVAAGIIRAVADPEPESKQPEAPERACR